MLACGSVWCIYKDINTFLSGISALFMQHLRWWSVCEQPGVCRSRFFQSQGCTDRYEDTQRKNTMTSMCCESMHVRHHVCVWESFTFVCGLTSAPWLRRTSATLTLSSWAAKWSGVSPLCIIIRYTHKDKFTLLWDAFICDRKWDAGKPFGYVPCCTRWR